MLHLFKLSFCFFLSACCAVHCVDDVAVLLQQMRLLLAPQASILGWAYSGSLALLLGVLTLLLYICRSQEIDIFGEISGVCFSPDADKFFVGIADPTYSSLLQFDRYQHQRYGPNGWAMDWDC